MFSLVFFRPLSIAFADTVSPPCIHKIRGIFDIGSGATKLDLFEIEVCPPDLSGKEFSGIRLVRILDDQLAVPVALEAGKSSDQAIGAKALAQLKSALNKLKAGALKVIRGHNRAGLPVEFAAIATHAVRTCSNRAEVERLVSGVGIPLRVLTQDEEGLAGYNGIRVKGAPSACRGKRLLVWDIGGGSMQWTLERPDQSPRQFGLSLGAESFKQKLITKLNVTTAPKCGSAASTPNPIGLKRMAQTTALADTLAADTAAELLNIQNICLVGIGGVHSSSIDAAITNQFAALRTCACEAGLKCDKTPFTYTRRQLNCLAKKLSLLDDCDPAIKGPFSTTNVSNLFLVNGFLGALHQDQVHVMNVNGGHGFALDSSQLKFQTANKGG